MPKRDGWTPPKVQHKWKVKLGETSPMGQFTVHTRNKFIGLIKRNGRRWYAMSDPDTIIADRSTPDAAVGILVRINNGQLPEMKAAYIKGIEHAAEFASEWDGQITGTEYTFGDIIRGKFNLLSKRDMRKKHNGTLAHCNIRQAISLLQKLLPEEDRH